MNKTLDISIPTEREVLALDKYQEQFSQAIAMPIKKLFEMSELTPKILAKRVTGVSEKTWSSYRQPSYKHSRSLHLCAILAWIGEVGMNAYYVGNKMLNIFSEFDAFLVSTSVYCHQMNNGDFRRFLVDVMRCLDLNEIETERLEKKSLAIDFNDVSIRAPATIDANKFAKSYYQSIAKPIRELRKKLSINQADMARYIGVSRDRYLDIEKGTGGSIPLECAVRLKVGFRLPDTAQFIAHMDDYPGFAKCRAQHQQVELILIELLKRANAIQKPIIAETAQNLAQYSKGVRALGVGGSVLR